MYVVNQLIFTYIFSAGLERSTLSHARRAAWLAFFAAAAIMLQGGVTVDHQGSEILSFLKSPLIYIISALFVCLLIFVLVSAWIYRTRRLSVSEAVYATALGYVAQHSYYCIDTLVETYILQEAPELVRLFISLILLMLTAAVIYWFAAVRMLHGGHYIAQHTGTAVLMAVMILAVILISAISSAFAFHTYHCIYALILCVYILVSQLERQQTLASENEAKVREQLLVTQKAQYRIYQENTELLNRKSHDLKHAVEALRHIKGEEGQAALESIEKTVRTYDSFLHTGHEGLDTILTQKSQICADHDILFTCICDGSCLAGMDQVDLFTLMGNLMDNAIEAVMSLPAQQRSISLSIKEEKGMVCIREENPCGTRHMENGHFLTTKEDAVNHGYGLRSMELVAEKYDGILAADVKEGVFTLTVTLFIPQA